MQVLSMSHVHIIGPRGTGKTTLANALVGAPAFPYFAGSPQPPPTVSISHVALTAPAKNRAFESSIQFDGQPREMPNHSGSLSLQLEALAGNDAVARIDVALATDGATAVTECHGDEQQPHQQTPLRILVVRWDHLEIDADKYLRGSFRNGSLLVVNVNQPETSLTLDEIRALSSTRLGVEHRSVFALNCRLALASVLLGDAAPAATVPHQGVLSSLLNKIGVILPQVPSSAASSSALAKPSVPATAGPRYRVESAASAAPPSGATSAPTVDRYTPVALQPPPAELFAAPTWREVAQPVRHSDSADDVTNAPGADRYELAVQRDARSVVESLVGQQYVPRHAAATASV